MEIDASTILSYVLTMIPLLMLALLSSHLTRFVDQLKALATEIERMSGILQSLHNDSAMQSQYTSQLFGRVDETRKQTDKLLELTRSVDRKLEK